MSADPGKWSPAVKFSYQWLVNGKPVPGTAGSRFHLLLGSHLGDKVTVQVTGTWADGKSSTAESRPMTVEPGPGA